MHADAEVERVDPLSGHRRTARRLGAGNSPVARLMLDQPREGRFALDERAELARSHHAPELGHRRREPQFMPQAEYHIVLLASCHRPQRVGVGQRERLLAEYVFLRARRQYDLIGVHRMGRAENERIDRRVRNRRLEIRCEREPLRARPVARDRTHVDRGRDPQLRAFLQGLDDDRAPPSKPHDRDVDLVHPRTIGSCHRVFLPSRLAAR